MVKAIYWPLFPNQIGRWAKEAEEGVFNQPELIYTLAQDTIA